ncbi:MAG: SpoIIE family protein phosphatase [Selenomonadaceae bacterium]|nr:SpoIIE family protein phosphatase [Selenomonadaceae bacterium]
MYETFLEKTVPERPKYFLFTFLAIVEVLLAASWIAFIQTEYISFTTMHIPVILAALFLGRNYGGLMGFFFGLISIFRASALNFENADSLFDPFSSGNFFGSIMIGLVSRVIFGYVSGILFDFIKNKENPLPKIVLVTIISCFVHGFLVLGSMVIFFPAIRAVFSYLIVVGAVVETFFTVIFVVLFAKSFWSPDWIESLEKYLEHNTKIFKERKRIIKFLIILSAVFLFFASLVFGFVDNLDRLSKVFEITTTKPMQDAVVVWSIFFTVGLITAGILFFILCFYFYSIAQEVSKENEKISAELNVAAHIQQSMLPSDFDFGRKDFEIFATMNAAKEIGGDFYDFYLLDDRHLIITIADVSGKGVPAALFMVTSKTILENFSVMMTNPDDFSSVISCANQQLCQNNDEMMFVTVFFGMLDLKTGEFSYVNAGHNAPLIYRKSEKKFEYLEVDKSCMLGVNEFAHFTQQHLHIEPGDEIFLYTDGITEAMNEKGEEFLEENLKRVLNENSDEENLEKLLEKVRMEVKKHSGKAEQSDDMTMMVLKFNGNQ